MPNEEPLPVTFADLATAGMILGRRRERGESDEAYHAALKHVWATLQRVVAGE